MADIVERDVIGLNAGLVLVANAQRLTQLGVDPVGDQPVHIIIFERFVVGKRNQAERAERKEYEVIAEIHILVAAGRAHP